MKGTANILNGIDTGALGDLVESIKSDPKNGMTKFGVTTTWKGGARTDTRVDGWELGGERHPKDFTIRIDEPEQLLGTNRYANPQEYLMAATNACICATYVAACAVNGIELESLEIRSEGRIDLRGFLDIDRSVAPGYEEIDLHVHIKGDGTPEQFRQIHEFVQRTSPNYYNIANAVRINPRLETEHAAPACA